MNQPYARVNQPYATLTLASALREMFVVQLYKNNAHALLSRILSILNLDWLQHARSVRGVYEFCIVIFPMPRFMLIILAFNHHTVTCSQAWSIKYVQICHFLIKLASMFFQQFSVPCVFICKARYYDLC